MAASGPDDEFEYDKPGAERSRRRRGDDDDDLDSDLEGDLLEEDWLSSKKNPSELSDEELNDDLLQSDEEDQNTSGQGEAVSLNATLGLSTSYDLQGENLEGGGYGEEGYEMTEGGFSQEEEGYKAEEYGETEEGMEYTTGQNAEAYEDEVLDLQIDEPLDDEFQVDDYSGDYAAEPREGEADQQEVPEAEEEEPEEEVEDQDGSQVTESEELEPEAEAEAEQEQEADTKEESDEDEDEEESGRLRFKTERKDVTVVRLSDAASKRRNIPETLELTEEAKADLLEFEEKERLRKQGRYGGRGRGGGRGGGGMMGGRGRGGRGGLPMFGMGDFHGDGGAGRGRIHEQRPPLMQVNLGMQPRMAPPQSHHHHHHHQSRPPGPRGAPGLFPNPISPLSQQPLQLLLPHRSPGPPHRPQQDLHRPPAPTHAHPHTNQQQQQQQPKNIHINPHFRGPSSSPVQVPLMPPAQNQPRPNIGPQRFPAPVDFQQHLQGNFVQPQRPPPQEPWRGPPPPHQEREPFFNNEPRFPGQHIFDLPGPAPLMNNNVLPLAGQGPMSFPQPGGPGGVGGAPGPGPGFGPLGIGQGQGPPGPGGMFQREPPRPNLQHASPPAPPGPRGFLGHRQPFPPQQPGPPFSPQHMPFGMQVRQRGLMQPHSQPQHHDLPSHHPLHQQQHRQDVQSHGHPQPQPPPPHNQHQHQQHQQHHQRQPGEQHPIMHLSHSPFRQPLQGGPRQMQQRSQNGQQRNNPGRMRMASPSSLQQLQSPQRNSNLRELPIAPSNNTVRPSAPAGQARLVTRATQEVKPGQGLAAGAVGRGRGCIAKAAPTPSTPSETKKESPPTQPSTPAQDPDEDEETRQYRLKIEEQKRLREEILKRKEMRRQMQAGVRKKELLERIGSLNPTQSAPAQLVSQPQPAPQPAQPVPSSLAPNGAPQAPSLPRGNVKTRLQSASLEPHGVQPEPIPQLQQQRKPPTNPQRQFPNPTGDVQPQAVRPGGKRTVMQRANSVGSPQIPQKVRVVKRLTGGDSVPTPVAPPAPLPHQHQQQQPQQQQQQLGRPTPQQRVSAVRKVTVATGGAQQPQEPGGVAANQTNRVVVPGRGRGRGAQVGRGGGGRMMMQQNRPNPRVPDPQPSTVSIDGLSSTTTEKQIKNLLNSIGPIQMFKMLPEQRKAIAKFVNPQHALSFQHSFHRHMIDLSHIDVTIIEG
ncbi:RNA-binding protein 33 isoform X2 [Colossoma macropomum]|uniref:RNA-binding protein 33 isoform X2 n=1 Tax=Colossoma macropomum TaxID=42526 RepID=UPI001864AFC4|nr:RNA-binding protein 33 isoform X2 [Colossoma macropomum]